MIHMLLAENQAMVRRALAALLSRLASLLHAFLSEGRGIYTSINFDLQTKNTPHCLTRF